MTHSLIDAMDDLARLIGRVTPDQAGLPTPCTEFDVAALRQHVLGWLSVFAAALAHPDGGERPDATAYRAPGDPTEAASEVRRHVDTVRSALANGVEDRTVRLMGDDPLPGRVVVGMLTAEVIAHGWDLARATGQPWRPREEACTDALVLLRGILPQQYRGPGLGFGEEVPVPDRAQPLEKLLAFTGRDPMWKAARV